MQRRPSAHGVARSLAATLLGSALLIVGAASAVHAQDSQTESPEVLRALGTVVIEVGGQGGED